MEGSISMGLRKGAWTEEEDNLLRSCILKFGEGRWHRVPFQAGLNRCRKSCRLRWLNYLKPNINREELRDDEVDLIIKLHRLLGNRWSLIAGRLPGRTANHVKNYWNTHFNKKKQRDKNRVVNAVKGKNVVASNNVLKTTVIKPRPRTFSKTSPWTWNNNNVINCNSDNMMFDKEKDREHEMRAHSLSKWWETLLSCEEVDVQCSDQLWRDSLLSGKDEEDDGYEKPSDTSDKWWENLLSDTNLAHFAK